MQPQPENKWQQAPFDALRKTFDRKRKQADDRRLKRIFKEIAKVPMMKEALDWADKHGVRYMIDHTCVNIGGYYTVGTGVVAISHFSAYMGPSEQVRVLSHEIRHMWQDWHGMIPTYAKNFGDYFIRLGLIEADARAYERLATEQFVLTNAEDVEAMASDKYYARIRDKVSRPQEFLWNSFLEWFDKKSTSTQFYGDHASKSIGRDRGIASAVPTDRRFEFKPYPEGSEPRIEGINIARIDDVMRLGEGFNGKQSYFAGQDRRDELLKKIIVPSLSSTFYGAATKKQKGLVEQIRKIDLTRSLAKGFWSQAL